MTAAHRWNRYFAWNAHRQDLVPPPEWPDEATASDDVLDAVARTLARFYLGETGEGTVARQAREAGLSTQWAESIRLYVAEEHRHGRELLHLLHALGHETPRRHWSEVLFRHGRRALGFRTKMLTIAAAEVVGVEMYGLLRDHVEGPIGRLGAVVAREEQAHLQFQRDFFEERLIEAGAVARGATVLTFLGITGCAVATFLVDHGPLLRALGVSRREVAERCARAALAHAPSGERQAKFEIVDPAAAFDFRAGAEGVRAGFTPR